MIVTCVINSRTACGLTARFQSPIKRGKHDNLRRSNVAASKQSRSTVIVRCGSDWKQPPANGTTGAGVNTWKTTNVLAVNDMVMEQGFNFVDLRDEWEAEKYGRYSSWANIPVARMTDEGPKSSPEFLQKIQERFPDPNTPLIIACDDGTIRSELAAKELCYKLGYTQVHILEGGIDDYLYKYPVADSSSDSPWGRTNALAVHDLMAQGFTLIDLREGWEAEKYGRRYEWRNIPVAYMTENGPIKNENFANQVREQFPDPNSPLILACDFGAFRSEIAARSLCNDNGYSRVFILEGGIEAYLEQFPIN